MKINWAEHIQLTLHNSPTPLLLQALKYTNHQDKAIDIGAGGLRDTRFLLSEGFDVTVVDSEVSIENIAKTLKTTKLQCFVSSFAEFNFPKNVYNIALAAYSLPFNPPSTFNTVFTKIKDSLAKNGIFCGQFFGINDEWSGNIEMTFHTKEQIEQLLSDVEIIVLTEKEKDAKIANGSMKHWHIFDFIVRKL